MPDAFGEPFSLPILPYRTSSDSPVLPFHAAATQAQNEQGTELEIIHIRNNSQDPGPSTRAIREHRGHESSPSSDSSFSENESILSADDTTSHLMKRRERKNKDKNSPTRPDLSINTNHNGHLNGSANGSMDSHIELRRKHGSSDSDSASFKARIMSREDFSLDNEPPPVTPHTPAMANTSFSDLPAQDKRNFLLLCILYFLQGIPMGLASGSVPFLLKPILSYGQIGIFSLAMYPYSLKLLWSPIVDAVWSKRMGRRKSWITPIQTISGIVLIFLGTRIDSLMANAGVDDGAGVWGFTGWWLLLVFLCATQDIAVDGWAISLLSIQNISYASTAQSVGLTAGSFMSHTVFLAFNAKDFANRWFRTEPEEFGLVTLGGYMQFWGWAYLVVTMGLVIFKREEKTKERDGIIEVYRSMWQVLKLKNIITIVIIHLIAKIGFVTNDAVTNLKLIDKGFGQANMALVVLIDFPFEISLGYYAGKWSTQYTPLRLWCWAFVARLFAAVFAQFTIVIYPAGPEGSVPTWYMLIVIAEHIYSTFTNTVMFVAIAAFHARIADPAIGGTYMTLLATVSNLGGTFPKIFVLKFVDLFTKATCFPASDVSKLELKAGVTPVLEQFSCALRADKQRCEAGGGLCVLQRDGYYITNVLMVLVGAALFWGYIERKALALQALPLRAWRVNGDSGYSRLGT